MDITSKQEELVLNGLAQIFPNAGDKKIESGNRLMMHVKEVDSEQFSALYSLTLEFNLNVCFKRSGNGITINLY